LVRPEEKFDIGKNTHLWKPVVCLHPTVKEQIMPWIKIIPEQDADGELKEVYKKIREQRAGEKINQDRDASAGGPPLSPPMLHSLNPKAMWHTAELMWEIMRGESRLTTAQREMIATVTAATLHCRF